MATQTTSPSIAPLFAVTILTSIGVTLPGETRAAERLAQSAMQAIGAGEDQSSYDENPSADAVTESRWAGVREDYVLGAGGQIVPQHRVLEFTGAPTRSPDGLITDHYHFNSVLQQGAPKCGPSPTTPAEIARLVAEAAQQHKVDVGFAVAVVTAESRLDRLRNSPKGARGPMQLMPETAERFGVTDICDPQENIDGGVRYLRELTDEFRNPLLVAAAYNAGEGRVREYGGIPPFKETVSYVAEIINIQMGLDGSGPAAREQRGTAADTALPSNASGVITSRERGQWLGGVMHF